MSEAIAPDGTGEPLIQFVPRTEEILDPKMDPITKVGTMARICYRSEPKEGEDEAAVNERIIRKCIKDGHESVLEHAVYSVFFPIQETHDSWKVIGRILGDEKQKTNRVIFRDVWQHFPTETQAKYLYMFNDPELAVYHAAKYHLTIDPNVVLPVVTGNVRAWRTVLKEKFFLCFNLNKDPLQFLVSCWALKALHDEAPIFFDDMIEGVNEMLGHFHESEKQPGPLDTMLRRLEEGKRTVAGLVETYVALPNDLYAGPASACASFSVIFTTDRATTHQLVRHRKDVGYSQESQRYVNYDKKGLRIIPLTLEPAKFTKWCDEHNAKYEDIFEDYTTGRVRTDKRGAYYFIPWYDGACAAACSYKKLLNLKEYWSKSEETSKLDLPEMPVETARDKLENDTATRIGVTWIMPDGFSNLAYWRLDEHAQYAIRSMLARTIIRGIAMKHPFFDIVEPKLRHTWIGLISSQHIFESDDEITKANAVVDDFEARLEAAKAAHQKALEEAQRKAEAEAKRLAEEAKANPDDPNAGVATPDENGNLPRTKRPIIKVGSEQPKVVMTEEKVNPPTVQFAQPPKEEAPAESK